jgi:hypothetical protein
VNSNHYDVMVIGGAPPQHAAAALADGGLSPNPPIQ